MNTLKILIKMALSGIGWVLLFACAMILGPLGLVILPVYFVACMILWIMWRIVEVCWSSELSNSRHPRLLFAVYFFAVVAVLVFVLAAWSRYF